MSATHGQVAVARGPLVFCLEQVDQQVPVADIRLRPGQDWQVAAEPALDGAVSLRTIGAAVPADDGPLHREWAPPPEPGPVPVQAVPYYAWANRDAGGMRVFVPLL